MFKNTRCLFFSLLFVLSCFLPSTFCADSPPDADRDGLSDADEINVHGTNPNLADTDGDGQSDGAEIRAGTNPKDPASVFRILGAPSKLTEGGWRINWSSVPGKLYKLQRADAKPGQVSWVEISGLTAAANLSFLDDTTAGSSRLYRVMLVETGVVDVTPPTLSNFEVNPLSLLVPGVVTLSVLATDNVGVSSVTFLDGNVTLGAAVQAGVNLWQFAWPVGVAQNGAHQLIARASDAAGNVTNSLPIAYLISLTNRPNCLTLGLVQICADKLDNVNGVVTASGNISINGVSLTANSKVVADTNTQLLTGQGGINIPGIGLVWNGSFTIDIQTGWLSASPGTIPELPPLTLNPSTLISAREMTVNVISNALRGVGFITNQIPRQALGPVVLGGSFSYNPKNSELEVDGTFAYDVLSGAGKAAIHLTNSTLTIDGFLNLANGTNSPYALTNANLTLSFENTGLPRLDVRGGLNIPEVVSLSVTGAVSSTGAILISGKGQGKVGPFTFNPIEASLTRAANSTLIELTFKGTLQHTVFQNFAMEGKIDSDGNIDVSGKGTASTGDATFDPLELQLLRNAATANLFVLNASGTLKTAYLQPIPFTGQAKEDGSLRLDGSSGPYVLFNFSTTTATFSFIRTNDAAGGGTMFLVAAVTSVPNLPTFYLAGEIANGGAASLTGTTTNRVSILFAHAVDSLEGRLSRTAAGVVRFEITAGELRNAAIVGDATEVHGDIATDGSGSVSLSYSTSLLWGILFDKATLKLSRNSNGVNKLEVTGGEVRNAGIAGDATEVQGEIATDGTGAVNVKYGTSILFGVLVDKSTLRFSHSPGVTKIQVTAGELRSLGIIGDASTIQGEISTDGSGQVVFTYNAYVLFGLASSTTDVVLTRTGSGNLTPEVRTRLNLPQLPPLDLKGPLNLDGSMTLSSPPASLALPGVILNAAQAEVVRLAGSATASLSISGNVALPGIAAAVNVRGTYANNQITFASSASLDLGNGTVITPIGGLPVITIAANASGTFEISVSGQLSVPGMASVNVTGKVTNGQLELNASVGPLTFGNFRLEGSGGGAISATVGSNGVTLNGGARLLYKGTPLTTASLPPITIASSGDFSFSVSASMTAGLELSGFDLSNAAFVFRVVGGVASAQNFSASLSIPGVSTAASVGLGGSLNADGTFSLSASAAAGLNFSGLAFASVNAGATVTLTQNSLTVSGNASGGLIAQFNLPPPPVVLVINANGTVTLQGSVGVTVPPIVLGNFRIEASGGGGFTATLSSSGLSLPAGARILYKGQPLTAPSLPQISISANGDFSVAVTAGMTAGLQINGYNLSSSSFTFRVTGGVAVAQNFAGSLAIPGLSTAASASVAGSLNSDGTFSLSGTVTGSLTLANLSFTTVNAGASATINQNGLSVSGSISGGLISQFNLPPPPVTILIGANGSISLVGSVSVSLPAIVMGDFRLEGSAGGGFTATLSSSGLALPAGARLRFKGQPLTAPSLPQVSISANGDFSIAVTAAMTAGLQLNGYNLSNSSFTFRVTGGVAVVQNFSGSLAIPGLSAAGSVGLGGSLNSNGSFSLSGTVAGSLSLSGASFTTINAGASATLTQGGLTVSGNVSGGLLTQFSVPPTPVTIAFASNGTVTLVGTVSVTLPPLVFGSFRIESSAGGGFTATLSSSGITVPNGARILYNGAPLSTPSLPAISIGANGNFSASVTTAMTAGIKLNGFSLNNAGFLFQVTGGAAVVQNLNASVVLPGFAAAASASVNGNLNSNGTFNLTGTTASSLSFNGFAVGSLSTGATVTFTQNSLTVGGTFGGGLITSFGFSPGTGSLTVAANGTLSVNGTVVISPLVFGQFRIEASASAAGNLAAITSSGLTIPAGAKVLYNGVPLGSFTLPQFSISATGDFNIAVGTNPRVSVSLGGFTLSNAFFNLIRSGGVTSISGFNGGISVGGLSAAGAITLKGNLSSDGNYSLSYTGAFTLGGTAYSNGTLTLSPSGLTAAGDLAIANLGTIRFSGSLLANGSFSLSQTLASQSFFGFTANNVTYTVTSIGGSVPTFNVALNLGIGSISSSRLTGTFTTSGQVSITATRSNATFTGFDFTTVALTFTHGPNTAAAGTLTVAADFTLYGVKRQMSGTLSPGGIPNLSRTGTLAIDTYTLGNANLTLNNTSFTISGNLTVAGLSPSLPFSGTVTAAGFFSMNANLATQTVFGFSAQNLAYSFSAGAIGKIALKINDMVVGINGLGSAHFSGTLRPDGFVDLSANLSTATMALYGFTSVILDFNHAAGSGTSASLGFTGNINVTGVPAVQMTGSISTSGALSFGYSGPIALGGFSTSLGSLEFTDGGGLKLKSGNFPLIAAGTIFNAGVSFSGSIPNKGNFQLVGTANLNFNGLLSESLSLELRPNGVFLRQAGNAKYGSLAAPINSFLLNSSGIAAFSASQSVNSGWQGFVGAWGRLSGTTTVSSSANGTLSGSLTASFYWWIGPQPAGDFYPGNQSVGAGGGIGSDGRFFVNQNKGGQNGFQFDLW